jgi:hypothetical protein
MLAKVTAAQTRNRPARSEFRLVSLLDRVLGAFEITKPRFGRGQSARRAREQLAPENLEIFLRCLFHGRG